MRLGVPERHIGELALLACIIKAALKDLREHPFEYRHLEDTEPMRFLYSDGLLSLLRLCGVRAPHEFIEVIVQRGEP
jgi:hypothetical protein